MEDLLEEQLIFNVKAAQKALHRHRQRKEQLITSSDVNENEPHEEEEEVSFGEDNKRKRSPKDKEESSTPKEKKPRKVASPVEGPCEGRIWLDTTALQECPGAEAGRGRNPEKDANTFERKVFNKKRHVFCKSCGKELIAYKKAQKVEKE